MRMRFLTSVTNTLRLVIKGNWPFATWIMWNHLGQLGITPLTVILLVIASHYIIIRCAGCKLWSEASEYAMEKVNWMKVDGRKAFVKRNCWKADLLASGLHWFGWETSPSSYGFVWETWKRDFNLKSTKITWAPFETEMREPKTNPRTTAIEWNKRKY